MLRNIKPEAKKTVSDIDNVRRLGELMGYLRRCIYLLESGVNQRSVTAEMDLLEARYVEVAKRFQEELLTGLCIPVSTRKSVSVRTNFGRVREV